MLIVHAEAVRYREVQVRKHPTDVVLSNSPSLFHSVSLRGISLAAIIDPKVKTTTTADGRIFIVQQILSHRMKLKVIVRERLFIPSLVLDNGSLVIEHLEHSHF